MRRRLRSGRAPHALALVLGAVMLALAPAANAAASEGLAFLESSSLCDEITYPSPSTGNDITFTLDTDYECGQFANGDWYVVDPGAGVTIASIAPARTGTSGASDLRHGVDVNPAVTTGNNQRWDGRMSGDQAQIVNANYVAVAGESVVKYVSNDPGSGSCTDDHCGDFAAVLTVLDEAPASPETTFRPPFWGTHKPLISTDDLDLSLLSRLDSSCCDEKIARSEAPTGNRANMGAVERTDHLRLDNSPSSVDGGGSVEPIDAYATGSWGANVMRDDAEVFSWLMLDDACASPPCSEAQDNEAKLPVLIGIVQNGIDLWAGTRAGLVHLRGGGGNAVGKLWLVAFAATMLDSDEMREDIEDAYANPRIFWETFSLYRSSVTSKALWGQMPSAGQTFSQWETTYWNELQNCGSCNLRDPYERIDGGAEPGTSYMRNTMLPTKYMALTLHLMPELQDAWPDAFETVVMDYADRVVRSGTLAIPDPCKAKGGTYGTDYGPNGSGGCILNPADDGNTPPDNQGRVPLTNGTTIDGVGVGQRRSDFSDQMWKTHRYVRPLAPATGTEIGVDEPFGVQPYGAGHVRVEFASDSAFTNIVCTTGWFEDGPGSIDWTYPGPIGASGVSCPLDPGTYHWRSEWGWDGLTPAPDSSPNEKRSEVRTFSVNTDCDSGDASGCVPGAVLELNETDFVCDEPLEDIADDNDGVLPLLVRITSDEPVNLSALVDIKAGCDGDGNTAVTLSNDCTTDESTCYSGTGYVPGQVDLILDIEGNGVTYGGRDVIVKVRQSARDMVITGSVDCGPRGPGPNALYTRSPGGSDDLRQEPVLIQGGERITFVDVVSGNWGNQTSTCMAANGAFDADETNASFPVEDVVCIGCEMVTCARGLTVGDSLRSGAVNSFFRTGDPQWKLVDLPATGSDNGVDAGQCYTDGNAGVFDVDAVDPINVGNFFDRYPYSPGGD